MTAPKTRRTGGTGGAAAASQDPPEGASGGGAGGTNPPPAASGNEGGTHDGESVEETVRRVLSEVLPDFLEEAEPPEGGSGGGGGGGGAPPAAGPAGTKSVEDHAESVVREAMDRIRAEGKTEERLEAIEKIVREEAPRTVRRLTKLMWGDPDKAKP